MIRYHIPILLSAVLLVFITSCDSKPKVIESVSEKQESSGSSALDQVSTAKNISVEHTVVVKEVLQTDKYSYLNVEENEELYWIAIPKSDMEVGEQLTYKGGLMKKDFYSREYDRVFETLYLVSELRRTADEASALDQASSPMQGNKTTVEPPKNIKPTKGSIRISELMDNLSKYNGKVVRITGKCMKVNPMIMNRNWIHIQDGSANNFDLTFTTAENIPLGSVITLEGTVALNKDFGAGYRYDVIIEGAVVVD